MQDDAARRWTRLQEAFHQLVDLPSDQQRTVCDQLAAQDPPFAAELASMLAADAAGETVLDRGVAVPASQLISDGDGVPSLSFGPYTPVRVLGRGGMGIVYLGHRPDLDAVAAIKVLRDAWLSPSRRDRFQFEQRTLATLEHPNIARILGADVLADGTPWFALEYIDGVPLTDRARGQPLPARLALFGQVCDAVRHAHERGVLHRDLKPANILVTAAGQVKLLDFGIATRIVRDPSQALTRTGTRPLTPAYASPEQLRGEAAGTPGDVYALGVMLFELLAGVRPYDVSSLTASAAAEMLVAAPSARVSRVVREARDGAVALTALRPAQWRDLDAVVATAMHPDPRRRYASVESLQRDLDAVLAGLPVAARTDTAGERASRLLRRHWRVAAVAALVLVGGSALAVSYTTGLRRARDLAQAEVARTTRLRDFLRTLLSGGEEFNGPADSLRVVTVVERGVREARALTADPVAQADLLSTLGRVTYQLGQTALADTLLRDAERAQRRLHGASDPAVIDVAAFRAGTAIVRGHADSTVLAIRALLDIVRRERPEDRAMIARLDDVLGTALSEQGEYDAALPPLLEAVGIMRAADSTSLEYSEVLTVLANLRYYRSEYAASDSLNRRALAIAVARQGQDHPSAVENLVNLGLIARDQGQLATADSVLRQALAATVRWYGAASLQAADMRLQLAKVLTDRGELREALALTRDAVAQTKAALGQDSPRYASALVSLANATDGVDGPEAGLATMRLAADVYARGLGADHIKTLIARNNVASLLTKLGRLDEAGDILEDVVAQFRRVAGPDDQNRAISLLRLGRVRLRQGRVRDAIAASTEGLGAYRKTITAPTGFSRAGSADLAKAWATLGDTVRAARYAKDSLP